MHSSNAILLRKLFVSSMIGNDSSCAWCHVPYKDADDFLARRPWRGYYGDKFVDDKCWDDYKQKLGITKTDKFAEVRAFAETLD